MITLLIQVFVVLLIIGLFIWAISQIPGLPAPVILIVRVIAVVILCLWLLQISGLIDASPVPHPLRIGTL